MWLQIQRHYHGYNGHLDISNEPQIPLANGEVQTTDVQVTQKSKCKLNAALLYRKRDVGYSHIKYEENKTVSQSHRRNAKLLRPTSLNLR
jgi:hypothetical protein